MTTKIFVSQIDKTNADGSQAPNGSIIAIGANGAYWANASSISASLSTSVNTDLTYVWSNTHTFEAYLTANAGLLINGATTINGNLVVNNQLTTNTLVVGKITSSNVVYSS